jgi:serine protease Do
MRTATIASWALGLEWKNMLLTRFAVPAPLVFLPSTQEVSVNSDMNMDVRNNLTRNLSSCLKRVALACAGCSFVGLLWAGELVDTIKTAKPAIVGIGSFDINRAPVVTFIGTGFAVGDGLNIITNAHVVMEIMDKEDNSSLGIITGGDEGKELFRNATLVALDKEHDLAELRIRGTPLPVMKLGDSSMVREGQSLVFTGFPIGMILGYYPVTHRGMVSSITPIVIPVPGSARLNAKILEQLRKSSFPVFQLDGTAYPGNSGSPLYDPETGVVYGVISMVFVKGLKEAALTQPSGITYAIPGNYVRDLLQRQHP